MSTIAIIQMILRINIKTCDHRTNHQHQNQIANLATVITIARNQNHYPQKVPIQKVNAVHDPHQVAQCPKNQKAERMISHHVSIKLYLVKIFPKCVEWLSFL